jgi:hypothetical protein
MPVQGRQDDDEEGGGGGGAGDAGTSSVAVGRAPRVSMRSTAASTLPPAANRADTQAPRSRHPISAINASSSVNRASYCVQSTGAAADAAGAGVAGAGVIEDGNPKLRPGTQGSERGEPRISQPHAARTMARARPKATAAPAVSHPCLGPSTQAAAGGKWQVRDTGGVEVRDAGGGGSPYRLHKGRVVHVVAILIALVVRARTIQTPTASPATKPSGGGAACGRPRRGRSPRIGQRLGVGRRRCSLATTVWLESGERTRHVARRTRCGISGGRAGGRCAARCGGTCRPARLRHAHPHRSAVSTSPSR